MVYTILLTWYKLGHVWTIWRIKIIQHNLELLGRRSQEKSSVLCTQLWRSNRRYDKSETYKWDGEKGETFNLQENVMLSTINSDNKLHENWNKKAWMTELLYFWLVKFHQGIDMVYNTLVEGFHFSHSGLEDPIMIYFYLSGAFSYIESFNDTKGFAISWIL